MVKVIKVAAWKIGESYIENAKEAERVVRKMVIQELMGEQSAADEADIAGWISTNWDIIEKQTKAAMVGT